MREVERKEGIFCFEQNGRCNAKEGTAGGEVAIPTRKKRVVEERIKTTLRGKRRKVRIPPAANKCGRFFPAEKKKRGPYHEGGAREPRERRGINDSSSCVNLKR